MNNEWVLANNRLPEKQGEYLVCCSKYCDKAARKKYGYEKIITIMHYNHNEPKFLQETLENPVTYWMPLPSYPKRDYENT